MVSSWLPPISIRTVSICVIWYVVSSITSQLTKKILVEYQYPLFLSQFQFLIGSILSLSFIIAVKTFPKIGKYFPVGSIPTDPDTPIINLGAFLKILPLGLFQFSGKYCSLSATSLISLAAVSSIKALSPLLIVSSYRIIYKVKFSILTYLSLVPLVGGVMLIITSESSSSSTKQFLSDDEGKLDLGQVKGLIYGFVSLIIFAAQNIYGKQLITWNADGSTNLAINTRSESPFDTNPNKYIRQRNNSIRLPYSTSDLRLDEKKDESFYDKQESISYPQDDYTKEVKTNQFNLTNPLASFVSNSEKITKPDQMTTIFYCSVIGFSISVTGFILNELPHVVDIITGRLENSTPDTKSGIIYVFYLILMSSVSHFIQALLAFHLLGSIPTVSYSIASMMKRIFLITVSIVLATDHHDPDKYFGKLSGEQLIGLSFTWVGLYCYDKWGSKAVKAKS